MSKSTNMVVYFDWKTVIYIYVCGKCRTQFMLPMEKSVTFTGACANEIIPSINHSFVYKPKEGRHVRIILLNFIFHLHIICYTDDSGERRDRMIYIVYWDKTLYQVLTVAWTNRITILVQTTWLTWYSLVPTHYTCNGYLSGSNHVGHIPN